MSDSDLEPDQGPCELDSGRVICHECSDDFVRPASHWSQGQCSFPDLTSNQEAIVMGLMLGDGTLRTQTNNPFVQVYVINRPFLEWIDDELGWLSTGVSLYRNAERSAEISRNNGHPDADPDNYHDVYVLQTRTMPQFSMFESWYRDDRRRKHFPSYVVLNPMITRIWYACDGSLNYDRRYPGSRPHATIGVGDEMENIGNVLRMFDESTFPHQPTVDNGSIRFSVDETEDFLDWMGDPPVGFEYKWHTDGLDGYEELKAEALD